MSLGLAAAVAADQVRRPDAVVHQVRGEALRGVRQVVAVVHPEPGVVREEGDLVRLALADLERVDPPPRPGSRAGGRSCSRRPVRRRRVEAEVGGLAVRRQVEADLGCAPPAPSVGSVPATIAVLPAKSTRTPVSGTVKPRSTRPPAGTGTAVSFSSPGRLTSAPSTASTVKSAPVTRGRVQVSGEVGHRCAVVTRVRRHVPAAPVGVPHLREVVAVRQEAGLPEPPQGQHDGGCGGARQPQPHPAAGPPAVRR